MLYTNAQSLTGKASELEAATIDLLPDIIVICETWCNSTTNQASLEILNYSIIQDLRTDRQDTANGIGGGLIVYARNGLGVLPCDKTMDFNQYSKFSVDCEGEKFFIYLIYRPPSAGPASKEQLCRLLEAAEKNCVLVGDYNLPNIDWHNGTAPKGDEQLVQTLQEKALTQLVGFPTHLKGNCLDLIITDVPEKVTNVREEGRLGKSDHSILMFDLMVSSRPAAEKKVVTNWKKADWEGIRKGLEETVWPTTGDQTSAEGAWQKLREVVDGLTRQYVPVCEFRERKSGWMTGDLLREMRRKRRLWKTVKNGGDREAYEEAAKLVKNRIRSAKRALEKRLVKEKDGNSKPFYNYIRKKTTSRTGIGPIKKEDGSLVTEDIEMAEQLNRAFASVFTREDMKEVPEPEKMKMRSKLKNSWITAEKVRRKIRNLKSHSAAGPDGIAPRLLQNCEKQIAPVLAMIFRKSLSQGEVPEEWKQANVVPIFKKGVKSDPGNYSPVSLTTVSCKRMESILKDDIMEHLARNHLINNTQHGFMKGRSCTTNLLEFMERVTKEVDSGKCMDIVYLDFAKAFDKVPTARLLKKVEAHGIGGTVGVWIQKWLEGRKQRVVVNGQKSDWQRVLSGVPQGSVLGPILFLLFINDLDEEVAADQIVKKFADDTKIAQVIEGPDSAASLQNTLDRLCSWARKWGMAFNTSKCHVMHVGRANPSHQYKMNGKVLTVSEEERDIGVTVTRNLKPSKQCQKAAQTAFTVLNQILKAFHYRDRHIFKGLYVQYVRPHLEFAVAAWSPWTQADTHCLERVQIRAVKAISGLKGQTYEERLAELNLQSLQNRRVEIDMVQTFKLVNGTDSGQWFTRADNRRATRATAGRDNLLLMPSQHEYRRNFFSQRVITGWNTLPDTVKEARNAEGFKRQYRRHLEGTAAHVENMQTEN